MNAVPSQVSDQGESTTLLNRLGYAAAALGLLVLIASIPLGYAQPLRFWASYLTAVLFVMTIGLGGLFFVLLHHATNATWSVALRRLAEQVAALVPATALLMLPLLWGARRLYPWVDAEAASLGDRSIYLDWEFFVVRSIAYLAVWSAMAWWLRRRSQRQDGAAEPPDTARLRSASCVFLPVYAVTLTLASFDWIMSLDPHWYSTVFGIYLFSGSAVAIFALLAVMVIMLQHRGLLRAVTTEHLHDLGKLLFGFTVFWAYIAFSQFLIIWYANLPEETSWFAHRFEHGWLALGWVLMAGHFGLPFFLLLSRSAKRNRRVLLGASLWMLAMHYVDIYWLVMPAAGGAFDPRLLDGLTLVGASGLAVGALTRLMGGKALMPVGDSRLKESLEFESGP